MQVTTILYCDLNLYWLGARIASVGTKDFDDAQKRVNKLLEIGPDNSIGHSEQVYLHLQKGDEDLAFQEIDSYIAAHPQDDGFKKNVAYDIVPIPMDSSITIRHMMLRLLRIRNLIRSA